jgi:Domain of unknown function (DUF5667)
MNRPARADEELDVVLDGHRHLFASELGPAVEAARLLGEELRSIQIAPDVAERHIAMALARARHTAVRARWRKVQRTAMAVAAAAALIVAPATLAGAALPGEPLYPLKRSIEAADLAFAFSPVSEARAQTRIAAARLSELHELIRKGRAEQIPAAMIALREAMIDANAAVTRAMEAEGRTGAAYAAADQLDNVKADTLGELKVLLAQGDDLNVTPQLADELREALPLPSAPPPGPVPTPTSSHGPAPSINTTGSTAPPPSAGSGVTSTAPPTTQAPTTQAPTTEPPTTQAPPPPTPLNQPTEPATGDLP